MSKSYYNVIEVLVNICIIEDEKLKILLKHKKNEPYKGYWLLPSDILSNTQTLTQCADSTVMQITNNQSTFLTQGPTFSDLDRDKYERLIACSYISIIQAKPKPQDEIEWFDIEHLPKMAYDHEKIIKSNIEQIKKQIITNENDILYKLFPNEFTLSQFQHFFENILQKQLDRRNFRKKLIEGKIVQETEKKVSTAGRPSKLYILNPKGGSSK